MIVGLLDYLGTRVDAHCQYSGKGPGSPWVEHTYQLMSRCYHGRHVIAVWRACDLFLGGNWIFLADDIADLRAER